MWCGIRHTHTLIKRLLCMHAPIEGYIIMQLYILANQTSARRCDVMYPAFTPFPAPGRSANGLNSHIGIIYTVKSG